jgi:hypothetical protein
LRPLRHGVVLLKLCALSQKGCSKWPTRSKFQFNNLKYLFYTECRFVACKETHRVEKKYEDCEKTHWCANSKALSVTATLSSGWRSMRDKVKTKIQEILKFDSFFFKGTSSFNSSNPKTQFGEHSRTKLI